MHIWNFILGETLRAFCIWKSLTYTLCFELHPYKLLVSAKIWLSSCQTPKSSTSLIPSKFSSLIEICVPAKFFVSSISTKPSQFVLALISSFICSQSSKPLSCKLGASLEVFLLLLQLLSHHLWSLLEGIFLPHQVLKQCSSFI